MAVRIVSTAVGMMVVTNEPVGLNDHFKSMYLWLHSPLGLGRFFSFLLYTQLVGLLGREMSPPARPLPTHGITKTENKRTQTYMTQVEVEPKIPVFERAKTVHASDRATALIDTIYIRYGKWSYTYLHITSHIPTRYEAGGQISIPGRSKWFVPPFIASRPDLGHTWPPMQWVPGASRGLIGWDVKLSTDLYLVPKSRMVELASTPPFVFVVYISTRISLPSYLHIMCCLNT
jgi:hypothetical protein